MPSVSALMPWSKTFRRVLSNAPFTSPSGGPSRMRRSSDMLSAAAEVLLRADRFRWSDMAGWRFPGEAASLLARFRCGDRVEACLRVGEALRS